MIARKKRLLHSQPYARLFGAFPVALTVLNQELIIQYSNRNFTKLFAVQGSTAGLEIGKFLPFGEIKNLVGRASRDRTFKEAEFKLRLSQGMSAFFKVSIIPFGLDSELDSLFIVSLEDVSERMRLEEQLLQAEKLSAMGHMAASIAHELGNPLSVIITSLEFLRTSLGKSHRELEEQIVMMEESAVRMHELLTSLADMSGLGRFQLEKEDINTAIMPVLSFVRRMAEKFGITLKSDLASELPPCLLDIKQLKQVFLNLLKNAMEAMPKGGTITVRSRYSTERSLAGPGHVIVEVGDGGIGVPSRDLETIFRPFYSTKKKGMGLGLALCRGIIEKHRGRIRVVSQEGKGSCFIVEIPVDYGL